MGDPTEADSIDAPGGDSGGIDDPEVPDGSAPGDHGGTGVTGDPRRVDQVDAPGRGTGSVTDLPNTGARPERSGASVILLVGMMAMVAVVGLVAGTRRRPAGR